MKIHQVEQQSPEWFALRDLKLTSSKATAIGNWDKGKGGLDTLARGLVRKHFSSNKEEGFETKDTKRGNECEPIARELYELESGNKVTMVGFIEADEYSGCSTDGLIGEDGVLEIKSPDDPAYFDVLLEMEVPSDYMWQAQMELLITGRKWCDLVFYSGNYDKGLITFRILPDLQKQEALKKGIETGKRLIKEYIAKYEERRKETAPRIIGGEPEEELVLVYENNKRTGTISIPKGPAPKKKK